VPVGSPGRDVLRACANWTPESAGAAGIARSNATSVQDNRLDRLTRSLLLHR
jgi:hypothetical protein